MARVAARVQIMSLIECLAVRASIIIGFGVTQVVAGFSRMVHTRLQNGVYWVQLVWAFGILMWMGLDWVDQLLSFLLKTIPL